ncbi:MAG: HAMP domain-containing protein [Nitrospirae bacterium]|nr:HAMP domain-containing protein [Nitrospirota bacterium]
MIKDRVFKSSLHKKLVAMMLFLSLGLISILLFLYTQSEKAIFNEFERQTAELSKAIQIGMEQATSSGLTDEKRLQSFLEKLNPKGVREISVISTSDKIISSTNPKDVGKWISKSKKEMIFKADLGQPVTGEVEGQGYNVMIPVVSGDKTMGYINLTLNTEDFSVFLQTSMIRRIVAASIILGIGTIVAVFLARRYTKPIEEVVAAAKRVALGDLDQELHTGRKDEIGELSLSFNNMIEKLRREREMAEKLRKAEHLAGIGQFAQSIAHEIKNPLNFINLSIDHIRETSQPSDPVEAEKFNSLINNMKSEIQRVSRFAESFLQYGRPFELHYRNTDMGRLIEEVVGMVSLKAQQEKVKIEKEYHELPELKIDPEFIKTCIYNIIINSFEAMPDGGVLTIRTWAADSKFFLAVKDTGIGVSADMAAKVFEPFSTTKSRGLGLGLAFTKRIIEEHKGKVSFESSEGIGSTMTLILPMEA